MKAARSSPQRIPRRIVLPLRHWLLLFLLGVALLAFVGMIIPSLFISEEWPVREGLKDRIASDRNLWENGPWQEEIGEALRREGMAAELYDADGRLLYRSHSTPAPASAAITPKGNEVNRRWVDHIELFENGRFVGHARIAHPWLGLIDNRGTNWSSLWLMAGFVAGSAVVTTGVGMVLFSRIVLTPLARMSEAAEHIRRGELDVTLPRSRVREVQLLIDDFDRMVEGLRQSIGRQAAVEEERRFFLAAIAHDLRTPLFSLRGRLEGVRDGVAKTPEHIRHYLNVALSRIDGLEKLVADLFSYSQLELLEYEPDMRTIDVAQLVEDAAESVRIPAEAKDVRLIQNTLEEPLLIDADPNLLTRALDNLLSNGLRHTPAGGTIEIGCRRADDRIHLWVSDTGPGIPDPVLQRLAGKSPETSPQTSPRISPLASPGTSPFHYRSDGGLGLGLTIVRRVAELHGGTLTARNRTEGGAILAIDIAPADKDPGPMGSL